MPLEIDMPSISAIILAGGRSSRMGRNKALLKINHQRLIDHVAERLHALSNDLIIVTNQPEPYEGIDARLVADVFPHHSSIVGLYSGLLAAKHELALVVGCDMPFLELNLLRYMVVLSTGHDAVIPRPQPERVEPLHAIYRKSCLPVIRKYLEAGDYRIVSFFPDVRVRWVEPAEIDLFDKERLSFFNVNTPQEWQWAVEQMHQRDRERRRRSRL